MSEIVFSPGGCQRVGGWMFNSTDAPMPEEGWKLHISGTSSDAQQILNAVGRTLLDLGVVFKFLRTTEDIDNQTGTQRGKWLVVYPNNLVNAFICVYNIDEAILAARIGFSWPAIVGEKMVGRTCIYTRYGGFTNDFVLGPGGQKRRSPRGVLKPDWIQDPWHLYDPDGDIDLARLSTFQHWPKHPNSFRRG